MPPPHWAATNIIALKGLIFRVNAMAMLTEGLMWAPEKPKWKDGRVNKILCIILF